VLNVSFVDQRADGHVATSMRARPAADQRALDCLHYCIPGPADAWAHALYNLLLNNARFTGNASARDQAAAAPEVHGDPTRLGFWSPGQPGTTGLPSTGTQVPKLRS
jgi:hypothetical protein